MGANAGEDIFCAGGLATNIDECDAATCCIALATCDSFKGCKGLGSTNRGKDVECKGYVVEENACDEETCCEVEDTCFPGEAEVSVQGYEGARMDEINLGMQVFAESSFEPIVGLLHLHTESVPSGAY